MVLVYQTVRLTQRRLAVVLNPAVSPEERRRQSQRQTQFERETVDARRQHHRTAAIIVAQQLHAEIDKVLAIVGALLAGGGRSDAHHTLADHMEVEAEGGRILLEFEEHTAGEELAGEVEQRGVVEEDEEFEEFAGHDCVLVFLLN